MKHFAPTVLLESMNTRINSDCSKQFDHDFEEALLMCYAEFVINLFI